MPLPERIPVFFLSGFLGAGKSTLLNEVLAEPMFRDTAVIINEFGDVAIDHLLVRRGETTISQVSTGCLCCSGTTDIRATLFDLHGAASDGLAPDFSRVIVEMSGLGDPAPLVNALIANSQGAQSLSDETVDRVFFMAGFVTLYDIIKGGLSIERHFEALKQIAFADRIVLTKTDLAKDPATLSDIAALPGELAQLNAAAMVLDRRDADLSHLFSPRPYSLIEQGEDVAGWLAMEAVLAADASHASQAPRTERPDTAYVRHPQLQHHSRCARAGITILPISLRASAIRRPTSSPGQGDCRAGRGPRAPVDRARRATRHVRAGPA
jgi:G3E family GTPase